MSRCRCSTGLDAANLAFDASEPVDVAVFSVDVSVSAVLTIGARAESLLSFVNRGAGARVVTERPRLQTVADDEDAGVDRALR
jgi:hypothetical protein